MQKGLQALSVFACCVLATAIAGVLIARSWDGLSVLPVVQAQDDLTAGSKFIEVEPENAYQAARVIKVTVGKQVVTPGFYNRRQGPSGVPFRAGDDWLKGLSFTVKNRTTKKIVKLFMNVSFPETDKPEYGFSVNQNIYLGRIPENVAYGPDGQKFDQGAKQPLAFGPGQEMTFSFVDYADDVRKRIEEHRVHNREDRRVGPNAQRQRQNRHGRKAGIPGQHADSVTNVLKQCRHPLLRYQGSG
jgi:hypothetical protein